MTAENTGKTDRVGNAAELADIAKRWASSPSGEAMIEQTAKQAVERTDRLQQARRVDPKALLEPVTL